MILELKLKEAGEFIDSLLSEAQDHSLSPLWIEILTANKNYVRKELSEYLDKEKRPPSDTDTIYTAIDYLEEAGLPIFVSAISEGEFWQLSENSIKFTDKWAGPHDEYVVIGENTKNTDQIISDVADELMSSLSVLDQLAKRLGPQKETEAKEIHRWLSDTEHALEHVKIMEDSRQAVSEKDLCRSYVPNNRCCEAHAALEAIEISYVSLLDVWDKPPFELHHDDSMFPGIMAAVFQTGARYPVIFNSNNTSGYPDPAYDKVMELVRHQNTDYRTKALFIEDLLSDIDKEMYSKRSTTQQFFGNNTR